jgi:hypothetical protein
VKLDNFSGILIMDLNMEIAIRSVCRTWCVAALAMGAFGQDRMIDLTRTPAADYPGVLGGSYSSFDKREVLPLDVSIRSLRPQSVIGNEIVEVEIVVRNRGGDTVFLPSSRNFVEVYRSGNMGRRNLYIGLVLTPIGASADGAAKELEVGLVGATGSPDVGGSRTQLGPGEVVVIKTFGQLNETFAWRKAGFGTVVATARAHLRLATISDDQLKIVGSTAVVQSNDAISVSVSWP